MQTKGKKVIMKYDFTSILDRNGKILIDNEPETRQALKDSTAYLLTSAKQDVMQSNTMCSWTFTTISLPVSFKYCN